MRYTLTKQTFLRFSGAIASAFVFALSGCDPNKPTDELSKRIEQDGYSFLPPVEPGWFIANRSPEKITLLKAGGMEGQSYLIEAGHMSLDGFAESGGLADFTQTTHRKTFPRPRFRIREHDISELEISDANCAMSHVVAEDRDPGTGSNVVAAVLMEAVGTICMHPSRANLGITMNYTHRSFPEDRNRAFEGHAMSILQSQQFSDDTGQGGN